MQHSSWWRLWFHDSMAEATLLQQPFVKPALRGRSLLSTADLVQWHYVVWENKVHSGVRQLLAGFPKPYSSAPYSNFSFPLLLSFYLTDHSCLASHRNDSICGPLHRLLCLPLCIWIWLKTLMAQADSCGNPPTPQALVPSWLLQHPCDKHNTYLILRHTSASGTTDVKKFVFPMQNWSSRLEFEWTIQKRGSFTSHTKASNTVWK